MSKHDRMRVFLQLSASMRLRRTAEVGAFEGASPTAATIAERRLRLAEWFAPDGFELHGLVEHAAARSSALTAPVPTTRVPTPAPSAPGPATVAARSRFARVPFDRYEGFGFDAAGRSTGTVPLPWMLDVPRRRPARDAGHPRDASLRVQRAALEEDDAGAIVSPGLDENDLLVYDRDSWDRCDRDGLADLDEARLFLAFWWARRRTELFGADLCERTYHVWLPPLVAAARGRADRSLALFPFVSLVRRPRSEAFRHGFSLSVLVAPIDASRQRSRRVTAREVGGVVSSCDGAAGDVERWDDVDPETGSVPYTTGSGRLQPYLACLAASRPRFEGLAAACDALAASGAAGAPWSLREQVRATLAAVALAQRSTRADVQADRASRLDTARLERDVLSEALTALRMTCLWSVLAASKGLRAATPGNPDVGLCADAWWPVRGGRWRDVEPARALDALPRDVAALLGSLEPSVARGARPRDAAWLGIRPEDRVDQLRFGERGWMAFAPQHTPCLVTVFDARRERFPARSLLGLLTSMGHMVVGAATLRSILFALGMPADEAAGARAANEYSLVVELEEMYDLDIANVYYRRLYRRFRELRGLEAQYDSARERSELLARSAEGIDRASREAWESQLTLGGGVISVGILAYTVAVLAVDHDAGAVADTLPAVAIVLTALGLLALRRRRSLQRRRSYQLE